MTFDYAFGSEEYYYFENTEFNDVFGFFISGPGITGPYSSPSYHPNGSINLATVPSFSPDLPITVSSVNDTTPFNAQFFIDNRTNQSNLSQVKGLTTVLTANAILVPGQTYHIRLAIADGSDNNKNSFIWMSGGSFSSSDFSPSVSASFSNNTCNSHTDLSFTISQDPNEEDIDYATITTSGGSFDFTSLSVGDNIGSASTYLNANGNTINSNLIVTSIISSSEIQAEAQISNVVLGSFTLKNLSNGIEIFADSPPDGNNYTNGNSSTVTLNNLFVNPNSQNLWINYNLTSELLCNYNTDQYFNIVNCITFSPSCYASPSNNTCQLISDLTINVSQDFNEEDIDFATFTSSAGSFDFTSLVIGDIIGIATMNLSLASFTADIVVNSIISANEISVDAIDQLTGANLGSFTLENLSSGGIEIFADSPIDGNFYTNGNNSTITFFGIFQNPTTSNINFNFDFTSELGSTYNTSNSIIICCPSFTINDLYYTLSSNICETADLGFYISQDCTDEDIQSALITSNGGSFKISSANVGDIIGTANLNYTSTSYSASLIVGTVVSASELIVDVIDLSSGNSITSINLKNLSPVGIEINPNNLLNDFPGDGDNYTEYFTAQLNFNNFFDNPNSTTLLNFNTQLTSELGNFLTFDYGFNISCVPTLDVAFLPYMPWL